MPLVEVRVLGPLGVDVAGRRLELRRQKQRAVIALLALRPGEVFSKDRLVDELWGAQPPKAAIGSLQNLVSGLRKVIPGEVLATRAPGYALDLSPELVDASRFELQVEEARLVAAPGDRARLLRAALDLWRGAPLADVQLGSFAAAEAGRLEELRTAALEERFEAELDLGAHAQLVGDLEKLAADHPLRERPTALLMLALYRAGRQVEALQAYQRARERLVEELGIDPWPELRRLEGAILRQDPSLDLTAAPAPGAGPAAPLQDRRKTVTILFADLVGSTQLGLALDPEVLRSVLRRYFDAAQRVVERHGGTVEKFIGDAVMAAFGIPTVHEDDALRAVRAARELREAIAGLNAELAASGAPFLEVRVGINTGEVLAADPAARESYATGKAVNVAVRLEEAAMPGEILLGESTHRLVSYAVETEVVESVDLGGALGVADAHRLLEVGEAPRPLGHASLVGRANELARLRAALAGVRAERRSSVMAVVADAGVGKTRLASELAASLATNERMLVGRCTPYGEGATYLPIAEIVAQAVPSRRADAISALLAPDEHAALVAQRVTQLTGETKGATSAGEIFWAVRRFLEAMAAGGATLVVLDDVHWAEPTLLDLIEYLAAWPAESPLLVLCLARRELLDERPGWRQPGSVLLLEPLDAGAAAELLDELAPAELPTADRDRIIEIAEGNALFLEQLLAYADEVGADAATRVPPSIEAILAARLERLERSERALLERAAVVGRECPWKAILQLTPPEELNGVDARLLNLVRRGLLVAERSGSEDAFRFKHVLVRDVAYAGMTKESRIGAHELYADWLDQLAAAPDELIGYHLEQASRYRQELMPGDEHGVALGRRAASLLAAAGRRAPARADWPGAAALLSRAVAVLAEGDPERVRLLPDLARAVGLCGDFRRELALLDEAVERAEATGDRQTRSYAVLYREHARTRVDPAFSVAAAEAEAREALRVFEEIGDADGRARAWARLAHCQWFSGHHVEARLAAERTLAHALSVGDEALEADSRGLIGNTLLNGPDPLDELFAYAEQLTEPGHRRLLTLLAQAHAMRGDFTIARRLIGQDIAAFEEVGSAFAAVQAAGEGFAIIEMLAGDLASAERYLTESFQAMTEAGETGHRSSVAARLASALSAQGRHEEAERLTHVSEETASPDDYLSQILWRSTRGRALAGQGRVGEGERFAREAVAIAGGTDDVNLRADTLAVLAEVRPDEAAVLIEEALRLYEEKGNIVSAGRARALQGQLSPAV